GFNCLGYIGLVFVAERVGHCWPNDLNKGSLVSHRMDGSIDSRQITPVRAMLVNAKRGFDLSTERRLKGPAEARAVRIDNRSPLLSPTSRVRRPSSHPKPAETIESSPRYRQFRSPEAGPSRDAEFLPCAAGSICRSPWVRAGRWRRPGAAPAP